MTTTNIAASLRAAIAGLALAFLILPAVPLGGMVPVPTVGGEASAEGGNGIPDDITDDDGNPHAPAKARRKTGSYRRNIKPGTTPKQGDPGHTGPSPDVPPEIEISFGPFEWSWNDGLAQAALGISSWLASTSARKGR